MGLQLTPTRFNYLPELTYSYNCVQHASTGYSPHCLFFGREPKLPVDVYFNVEEGETDVSMPVSEYVADHFQRLTEMYAQASSNTQEKASERKRRNDVMATDTSVSIGTTVVLKDPSAKARHKIQDIYGPDLFIVVERPDPEENV